METYYAVKLNDGNTHIIYADNEELENMVHANIIKEYICTLDNWSVGEIYEQYIRKELEDTVDEICCHIQNAKGIESGDCPPDLAIKLDNVINSLCNVITDIIKWQEESRNEHDEK